MPIWPSIATVPVRAMMTPVRRPARLATCSAAARRWRPTAPTAKRKKDRTQIRCALDQPQPGPVWPSTRMKTQPMIQRAGAADSATAAGEVSGRGAVGAAGAVAVDVMRQGYGRVDSAAIGGDPEVDPGFGVREGVGPPHLGGVRRGLAAVL